MKNLPCCRFCSIIDGEYKFGGIDEPFVSSSSYIAIASIGALIEGWTLVIPKDHSISLKRHYRAKEFKDFVTLTMERLSPVYGGLICFEHGSNIEGSPTSCGTDHAHLHLVPYSESLLPELRKSGLTWIQSRTSEIEERTVDSEFLFYCELGGKKTWDDPMGHLHILEKPISQFFRSVLAKRLGALKTADYKKFPHLAIAQRTREMVAGSTV